MTKTAVCPYCKEPIAAGVTVCPQCGESLRTARLSWLGTLLMGGALGLFLTGVASRIAASGPVPEASAITRSLEFIELTAAAVFLAIFARVLDRRG